MTNEDFLFVAETSRGSVSAVISKSALHRLATGHTVSDSHLVHLHQDRLNAILEKKLAKVSYAPEERIRIHGTDL